MVDLDKPNYGKSFLENDDYCPCKSLKVFMPKFNGSEAEEWLYTKSGIFLFTTRLQMTRNWLLSHFM